METTKTVFIISGIEPLVSSLGVYTTFNIAREALFDYFYRCQDSTGAGKYMYQYDRYSLHSRALDTPAHNQDIVVYEEYIPDYTANTLKKTTEE